MKLIFTIGFVFVSSILFSQDSLFNYFSVSATSHESVLLNWELKSGSTCNGTEIQRSTDTINFTTIHSIAGICGNSSSPVSYEYDDLNPESNRINYYRLKPGNGVPTGYQSVFFVDFTNDGFTLFPNPATDFVSIYFRNKNFDQATFNLVNEAGQLLHSETTNGEYLLINTSVISAGTCFFTIELNQQLISGAFIKN